jgi:hypothetical protein
MLRCRGRFVLFEYSLPDSLKYSLSAFEKNLELAILLSQVRCGAVSDVAERFILVYRRRYRAVSIGKDFYGWFCRNVGTG